MTQEELFKIAVIVIGLGISLGIIIVLLIQLKRRKTVINSLVSLEQLVGHSGTVEIPFDQDSKGKIRVKVQGSLIDIVALSNLPYHFRLGEEVLIIEAYENKVRVVPMSYLTDSSNHIN